MQGPVAIAERSPTIFGIHAQARRDTLTRSPYFSTLFCGGEWKVANACRRETVTPETGRVYPLPLSAGSGD